MKRRASLAVLAFLTAPAVLTAAGPQAGDAGVRMIAVATEAEATRLAERIASGESFDGLARAHSTDPSRTDGGYLGRVSLGALRREFRDALDGLGPGEVSPPVRTGGSYYLLGILSAAEQAWIDRNDRGLRAIAEGDFEEAERGFTAALETAEGFGAGDYRLAESLKNLADLHYARPDLPEAGIYYQRLLELLDASPPGTSPELMSQVLTRLGEIALDGQDYAGAHVYYGRALALIEESPDRESVRHAAVLAELVKVREAIEDYAGAELYLRQALDILEPIPGTQAAAALGRGLDNLARLLVGREAHLEAEAEARRGLALLERTLGPDHSGTTASLLTLASILEARGQYDEAQELYRRSVANAWGDPGIGAILDALTRSLGLAPFRDDAYRDAFESFQTRMDASRSGERLPLVVADILTSRRLRTEAEAVLLRAAERIPGSRAIRIKLAELYIEDNRVLEAIEHLELGTRISRAPGAEADVDRIGRSYFYQRLGDVHLAMANFEEALAAYTSGVEIDPSNYSGHVGLGNLWAQENRLEEALASYDRAIQLDPGRVTAYLRLAEANLSMRRFPEALGATEKVLEIEPENLEVRYMKSRILRLMGRIDEARIELEDYQTREAEDRARDRQMNDAEALNARAAAALAEGRYDESIELYRSAIETYPGIPNYYLALGAVLSRQGRHGEAARILEATVELGVDDFLVHKSLALEYAALGDAGTLEARHETIYLRKLYSELEAGQEP